MSQTRKPHLNHYIAFRVGIAELPGLGPLLAIVEEERRLGRKGSFAVRGVTQFGQVEDLGWVDVATGTFDELEPAPWES